MRVPAFAAGDINGVVYGDSNTWGPDGRIAVLDLNDAIRPEAAGNNDFGTANTEASFPDVAVASKYYAAVEYVNGEGLMVGDNNGYFNPENPVTRAEMAVIICRVLGETVSNSASSKFTDVPETHWANLYIEKVADLGIVSGYGNGLFGPSKDVTYAQAVTMVVRALGEENNAAGRGGFPDGYLSVAADLGLLSSIQSSKSEKLSRGNVAILLFNWGTHGNGGYVENRDNDWNSNKKEDLAKYLGTDLLALVNSIEGMYDEKVTDGSTGYTNGSITVESGPDSTIVDYICIDGDCNYSILGIEYGMTFSDAIIIADKCSSHIKDDFPRHKRFIMHDGSELSIYTEDGEIVYDISLFDLS